MTVVLYTYMFNSFALQVFAFIPFYSKTPKSSQHMNVMRPIIQTRWSDSLDDDLITADEHVKPLA